MINHEVSSDFWTKAQTVADFLGCIPDAYLFAQITDNIFAIEPDFYNISYIGLGVGIGLGLYATISDTYCEYLLNKSYQGDSISFENSYQSDSSYESDSEAQPLLTKQEPKRSCFATAKKFTLLGGDWLDSASDRAAPITFVADLMLGSKLSRWQKLGVQGGALAYGFFVTVAHVRTSKHVLEKYEQKTQVRSAPSMYNKI